MCGPVVSLYLSVSFFFPNIVNDKLSTVYSLNIRTKIMMLGSIFDIQERKLLSKDSGVSERGSNSESKGLEL